MTRRFRRLAWTAAGCTYLLIILGAVVRITGSGMGCGEHWPLCNGRLLPPLDLPTLIEYTHRLVAAAVSALVLATAAAAWRLGRGRREPRAATGNGPVVQAASPGSGAAAYTAAALLALQVALGAVAVKLVLPPWTVVLHLGTAMLLLAALLIAARGRPLAWPVGAGVAGAGVAGAVALGLGFVTVLFGALTANLGAASACLGFPLCNGQLVPAGNYLQHVHWTHRLLAYALLGTVVWWAAGTGRRAAWWVGALVGLQVAVAAVMVVLALPAPLQAAHVAVGTAVWAGLVLAAL